MMRLERCGLMVTRPGRSTTVSTLDTAVVPDARPVVAAMCLRARACARDA